MTSLFGESQKAGVTSLLPADRRIGDDKRFQRAKVKLKIGTTKTAKGWIWSFSQGAG